MLTHHQFQQQTCRLLNQHRYVVESRAMTRSDWIKLAKYNGIKLERPLSKKKNSGNAMVLIIFHIIRGLISSVLR